MEWIKKNKGFLALLTFSTFWALGALYLLYPELNKDDFYRKGMPLNELGDYLAGAFSPLAFLWLVYGYFMQNKELRNQIDSIIQRNEIEISKEERELSKNKIENERRLLDFKNSQPVFEIKISREIELIYSLESLDPSHKNENPKYEIKVEIINKGKGIFDLLVLKDGENIKTLSSLKRGGKISFNYSSDDEIEDRKISINFSDFNGILQSQDIHISNTNGWTTKVESSSNMRP